MQIPEALERARALVRQADDEGAKQAYLDVLRHDPTNFFALNELGTLALTGGFRSAARTAYRQAIAHHPQSTVARVNLANVLREDGDPAGAREHYEAALAIDPDHHEAHQGMAWVLTELGLEGADHHRERGFAGRALLTQPYRGTGAGVPILLLVSARGGNLPTRLWIDDRRFTLHVLYAEYAEPALELPRHQLAVNAIGDADLCPLALERAEELLARTTAPVINRPARVLATGRIDNARRLAGIPGVIAPRIERVTRHELARLEYPLLLRSPGFHTGRHFVHVESRAAAADAAGPLAGGELLAIQYLDARGADGMARKYRVMFIDGRLYPLHLAISADWKVHYFSADMARNERFRDEERRFLLDMPGVLGTRAMEALARVAAVLGLDYAGVDFALSPDGAVLLFEANATMVIVPPGPGPEWDYRRPAIEAALQAARRMLDERVTPGPACTPPPRP
jgi:tetratricopeptide (TPR) repeat protein